VLTGARPVCWLAESQECLYPRAQLLVSAYAVGLAEATRNMAVEYAKAGSSLANLSAPSRRSTPVRRHGDSGRGRCVPGHLRRAGAGGGTRWADFHSVAAKLVAVEAALQNAAQNIQVHGAIGFTAEADAHCLSSARMSWSSSGRYASTAPHDAAAPFRMADVPI